MKKSVSVIAVIAVVALAAFIIYDALKSETASSDFFAMNTYISAEVEGENAEANVSEIQQIVEHLDTGVLSRTAEDSVISNLNKNGEADLSADVAAYFSLLLEICGQSEGAFDITLGAVSDLWNFGGTPSVPEENDLAEALYHSGYKKISVSNGKAVLNDSDAIIDFGAAGKGIALDSVKSYLETQQAERAVVSVGGSILLYGEGDFTVGVRNPYGDSADYVMTLTLPAGCVSTSGSYEQCFEENGKTYHHILNPETGYPVDNSVVSVTVISENGLLSDALSTACFALGIEKGFELAEEYGAEVTFMLN